MQASTDLIMAKRQVEHLSDEGLDIANWVQDMVNVSFTATLKNMAQLSYYLSKKDFAAIDKVFGKNFVQAIALYYQHHEELPEATIHRLAIKGLYDSGALRW